jgi:hypothetical protein
MSRIVMRLFISTCTSQAGRNHQASGNTSSEQAAADLSKQLASLTNHVADNAITKVLRQRGGVGA